MSECKRPFFHSDGTNQKARWQLRGVSSVGRAPQWHCGGQRFEPATLQFPLNFIRMINFLSLELLGKHWPSPTLFERGPLRC